VSTEVRILGHIAAIHTLHHEWQEAIGRYEEAVERAGNLRDLSRVARMYNDLSIAYQQTGALAEAAAYLHKAVAIHQMQNDRQELAYSENNLASVLMEQGQLATAERHLQVALKLFDELQLETRRSHVVLSLSELNIARGDYELAERYADQALTLATRNLEPMTAALAHQVLGQMAELRQDQARADDQFSKALAILRGLEIPQRLIECHTKYAEILEDRGDIGKALQHLKAAVGLEGRQNSMRTQAARA
jgi:tetratricopeptide (TPR) repeat protein